MIGRAAERQRQAQRREAGQEQVELRRVFRGENAGERYYGASATSRGQR
jgi:hypothetical protein